LVGGFLGFPGQLFHKSGWYWIEEFMEPVILMVDDAKHVFGAEAGHEIGHAVSLPVEWGLVVLSVGVALVGWMVARRFYTGRDAGERPRALAERFSFAHRMLVNKYWVDELYDATVIAGTLKLARFLWEVDARVVDGAVNGTRHATVGSSFLSGIFDLRVVDGAVNLIAEIYDVASHQFRRLQVGFTQGYAMVMVFGAAALLVVFLITY
jgi:NADH-quinone oxidoreductase subunit L